MTDEIQQKIQKMIPWTISNQGIIKDDWKIIEAYKKDNKNVYILIECIHCKEQRLVLYYNFLKSPTRPCTKCGGIWNSRAKQMIGTTVGHYLILDLDHISRREENNQAQVYFKTRCIYCGNECVTLFNKSAWESYEKCPNCPRIKLSYTERRFKEYQQSAKDRNLDFLLTYEDFENLISKPCTYCGKLPEYHEREIGEKGTISSGYMNGIDRIDSSIGYCKDNCVSCCSICNYMKSDLPKHVFFEHITNIYKHIIQGSTTIPEGSTLK